MLLLGTRGGWRLEQQQQQANQAGVSCKEEEQSGKEEAAGGAGVAVTWLVIRCEWYILIAVRID